MDVHKKILVEVAWEVCNQVGGIYTVIRSKAPSMVELWGDNYCLIGPLFPNKMPAEFEPTDNYNDAFGRAVLKMQKLGLEVHYGTWLVSGKPKVILMNFSKVYERLNEVKYFLWSNHQIDTKQYDELVDQTIALGEMVRIFLEKLSEPGTTTKKVHAHFHEWMVGTPIPQIKKQKLPIKTVFTTHATQLGRYLAMDVPDFYDILPKVDWLKEANRFGVLSKVLIERAASQDADIFTTVSDITAQECEILVGRKPEVITPNGLNIERFVALHEFQNLHLEYKQKINQFVMGHFFHSYSFDLEKTLYFFTSGRFEYTNKGFDITIDAINSLNKKMQKSGIDMTVVLFIVTNRPTYSINSKALQSRAIMEEVRDTCTAIRKQVGERLFYSSAYNPDQKMPSLNDFVDEYWKLRLRRTLMSWKNDELPYVVTHDLVDQEHDAILNHLKSLKLANDKNDKVKIVYHPDFISSTNPLFGMEYHQFVRGCHLGIFPSYYEPWGYTPLECIASGIPTVTSDLSGFGDYVQNYLPYEEANGIYMLKRRHNDYAKSTETLANMLFSFVQLTRRERITQRNVVENSAENFSWNYLIKYYMDAYKMILEDE
ncbi:glycosyltransferase [Solitalea koreensis]|uniref:Glycogen(Starch) synthase n=1 Tax=Solitalea koreensis TaxID=543615 RepID=A0A521E2L6_9SPHI|nr:glycosyltransferase [Solitalea koreensis]SMO77561.1 glycogen(starch) synthase [Solitalea koreensis]